ncbi:uncharacterized protein K452DRAFT_295086 [Aplosporella prunicola CBS 121167]|uniref:C2H2-type domain-containing protein n=1 Tax=Aplosporella prunicola CBS 121167 TaxID=1176127 RepID=A0A6A6BS96_9PEZI|nr:uncharacterized protein K452DRAFT_295086 [Aplosporella prunicola CBS 121167]KAF2145451.1 hypothetical protein K452DRAFT_295086 [Aplosporella prunicola CBS 121167]
MASPRLINYAIDYADADRVRATLQKLCASSGEARALVEAELLRVADFDGDEEVTGKLADAGADAESKKRERNIESVHVVRYAKCQQCEKEFDTADNKDGDCVFHTELLYCDEDSPEWIDWDPRCHGPYDTEINRKSFPKGFKWDCCEKFGNAEGCEKSRHVADTHYVWGTLPKKAKH